MKTRHDEGVRAANPPSRLRSRRLRGALAGVVATLLAGAVFAQEGGEIDIEVTDQGDKSLTDVTVEVVSAEGAVIVEGVTNKKGKFKRPVSADGTYTLRLRKAGYGPMEREVELNGGVVMSGTLKLMTEEQHQKFMAVENFNAGVTAIQGRDAKTALAKFAEAAKLDPSIADAHFMIAAIHMQENDDVEAAAPAVESYLALQPLDAKIAPIAYEVFRVRGNEARKKEAAAILKSTGGGADAAIRVYNAGVEANKAGKRDEAIALWQEAIDLDPKLASGHQSLAALAFNDRQYETAATHIHHLLELRPGSKPGLRMGFYSYAFLGRDDEALEVGKKWSTADDSAAGEVLEETDRLFEENATKQARQMAELLVAMAPQLARGHYTLGRILAASGEIAAAKTHLQKFLELAPDDAEAELARQMLAGL